MEKDQFTCLNIPILNSTWASNIDTFSSTEIEIMKNNNVNTIVSILKAQKVNSSYVLIIPIKMYFGPDVLPL